MQIQETSLVENQRPCAPEDCPRCGGSCKLHRLGSYERSANPEGSERATVQRFVCRRCNLTIGVIPKGMLPYVSLPVAMVEEHFDHTTGLAGDDQRPPPASEVVRGCLKRAARRLQNRIPFLCGCLGQMLPMGKGMNFESIWRALRSICSLEQILLLLARNFKTSLLGSYRSFKPPWQRDAVPA